MKITLELPEDIAAQLSAAGENLSRAALESFGLEQYRAGKKTMLGFFVGQVMKASKGQASPQLVNELLLKKLE